MRWHVDPEAGPIYEQIVRQVETALARGELKPGSKLPSARVLAEVLRINPNTVIRAFEVMERRGLTETRRGLGTFIRQDVNVSALRRTLLKKAAERYLAEVQSLGLDQEAAKAALEEVETHDARTKRG